MRIREHQKFIIDSACRDRVSNEPNNLVEVGNLDQTDESIYFAKDKKKERICVMVSQNPGGAIIQSSYFIGIDRLPKSNVVICVEPKLNNESRQTDCLLMLVEALKERENLDHLDMLLDVKSEEPWIEYEHNASILVPFVIVQFLSILKCIVSKGLKKGYSDKIEDLNSKIKGKIRIGDQIKHNVFKNKYCHISCKYQQHGFDIDANRFLKFVLSKVNTLLGEILNLYPSAKDDLHYLNGAFESVKSERFSAWKGKEVNPFYRNYNDAFKLGNLILKISGYDLNAGNDNMRKFPPHWIDMSKLFELYVFKKLRSFNPLVAYQRSIHRQLPDFLVKTEWGGAVVDAKYKPRYSKGNPSMEDARQLAGYTRLNGIFDFFGINDESRENLPVFFIYPKDFPVECNVDSEEEFVDSQQGFGYHVLDGEVRESKAYYKMFLQEVKLPFI